MGKRSGSDDKQTRDGQIRSSDRQDNYKVDSSENVREEKAGKGNNNTRPQTNAKQESERRANEQQEIEKAIDELRFEREAYDRGRELVSSGLFGAINPFELWHDRLRMPSKADIETYTRPTKEQVLKYVGNLEKEQEHPISGERF